MNEKNTTHENFEPELEALLADLKKIPPRDPAKAARTKANFISELDETLQAQIPSQKYKFN